MWRRSATPLMSSWSGPESRGSEAEAPQTARAPQEPRSSAEVSGTGDQFSTRDIRDELNDSQKSCHNQNLDAWFSAIVSGEIRIDKDRELLQAKRRV